MCSPNLEQPMATSEVTKKHDIRAPHDQRTSRCSILRGLLLGWAFLRLVVTVLWIGLIMRATVVPFLTPGHREPPRQWAFGAVANTSQLVEFGMIITFIIAGVKKSASLYRAYYRYCILTLIIYIIGVILCLALSYDFFVNFYLTYYITYFYYLVGLGQLTLLQSKLLFVGAAIVDIALEVLLMLSVKYLINNYSSSQNNAAAENV